MAGFDYRAIVGGTDAVALRAWHFTNGPFGWEYGFGFVADGMPLAAIPAGGPWYDICDLTVGEMALCVRAENLAQAKEQAARRTERISARQQRALQEGRNFEMLYRIGAICVQGKIEPTAAELAGYRPVVIPDGVLRAPFLRRSTLAPGAWEQRIDGYTTYIDGRPYGILGQDGGRWEVTDLRTGVCFMPPGEASRLEGMYLRQVLEHLALNGKLALRRKVAPDLKKLEAETAHYVLREKNPAGLELSPEARQWYLQAGITGGARIVPV